MSKCVIILSKFNHLLQLIRHYEANGVKIHEYRPFLFGEAASIYYSASSEADTSLWRQPTTSQILDLFTREMIEETIGNFPIERALKVRYQ